MESYATLGFTDPDHDWWEQKTDLSYIYEDETLRLSAEEPEDRHHKSTSHEVIIKPSEEFVNKIQLGSWIAESRQETPSMTTISALAGYINIAYPIMRLLDDRGCNRLPPKEKSAKELLKKMENVKIQLQNTTDSLTHLQSQLKSSSVASGRKNTKLSVERISQQMIKRCELMNVLLNLVQNLAQIPTEQEEINKIYGSSVDLA